MDKLLSALVFASVFLLAFPGEAVPVLLGGKGVVVEPFSCRGMAGESLSLDSLLDGREFLVITFWGVNCAPCVKEILWLNDRWKNPRFRERANVIAVNTDGVGPEALARELRKRKIEFAFSVVPDEDQSITNRFVNGFIPLTVLIDKSRRVRYSILGASTDELGLIEKAVYGQDQETDH